MISKSRGDVARAEDGDSGMVLRFGDGTESIAEDRDKGQLPSNPAERKFVKPARCRWWRCRSYGRWRFDSGTASLAEDRVKPQLPRNLAMNERRNSPGVMKPVVFREWQKTRSRESLAAANVPNGGIRLARFARLKGFAEFGVCDALRRRDFLKLDPAPRRTFEAKRLRQMLGTEPPPKTKPGARGGRALRGLATRAFSRLDRAIWERPRQNA